MTTTINNVFQTEVRFLGVNHSKSGKLIYINLNHVVSFAEETNGNGTCFTMAQKDPADGEQIEVFARASLDEVLRAINGNKEQKQ